MFKSLAVAALQFALCHFLGFCMSQDECPDGVCVDAAKAVDSLGERAPVPAIDPTKTQAVFSDWNWDAIGEVTAAITTLVLALKKLIGDTPKVG